MKDERQAVGTTDPTGPAWEYRCQSLSSPPPSPSSRVYTTDTRPGPTGLSQ